MAYDPSKDVDFVARGNPCHIDIVTVKTLEKSRGGEQTWTVNYKVNLKRNGQILIHIIL
jgi:hypothetical protein